MNLRLADVGLACLGVLVSAAAVHVVTSTPAPASADAPLVASATPHLTSPRPVAAPSLQPPAAEQGSQGVLLLVGPDLKVLGPALSARGWQVALLDGGAEQFVVKRDDLQGVQTPDVVVLEVLPGGRTSSRVRDGLAAVGAVFPQAEVFVTGPFSEDGALTNSAAKEAAKRADRPFVDALAAGWGQMQPNAAAQLLAALIQRE